VFNFVFICVDIIHLVMQSSLRPYRAEWSVWCWRTVNCRGGEGKNFRWDLDYCFINNWLTVIKEYRKNLRKSCMWHQTWLLSLQVRIVTAYFSQLVGNILRRISSTGHHLLHFGNGKRWYSNQEAVYSQVDFKLYLLHGVRLYYARLWLFNSLLDQK
jgi:hypothetical protein